MFSRINKKRKPHVTFYKALYSKLAMIAQVLRSFSVTPRRLLKTQVFEK